MERNNGRIKIFTWHIHGSYLYYLSQGNYDIYIPLNKARTEGYYGRGETFPFGQNVIEVEAGAVRHMSFDCILFQTNKNYLTDQFEILSEEQRRLPRIYLEHDPPCGHPTNTEHIVKDPDVCLIHVTAFNKLMWNNLVPMVRVIDHGIVPSAALYTGELNKGLVIVNNLYTRGRKLGADIFEDVKQHVPLDLIGMGTKEYGGLGEVLHPQLPAFTAKYRFLFNPIRYTSLGLAVLEAMMNGLPVVALGTTEYTTVITNGYSGFIDTNIDHLITKMKQLLAEPGMARSVGLAGRSVVEQRFSIDRFTKDWEDVFHYMIANHNKNTVYEKKYSVYQ